MKQIHSKLQIHTTNDSVSKLNPVMHNVWWATNTFITKIDPQKVHSIFTSSSNIYHYLKIQPNRDIVQTTNYKAKSHIKLSNQW